MSETCRTCLYWWESHKGLGECHKKSPGIATDGTDMAVWPNTHDWQDCGDYKPTPLAGSSLGADAILATTEKPRYTLVSSSGVVTSSRSLPERYRDYFLVVDIQECGYWDATTEAWKPL